MIVGILGASRGVGRAFGRACAARGDALALLDSDADELARSAADLRIRAPGSEIRTVRLDAPGPGECRAWTGAVHEAFSGLDALVIAADMPGREAAPKGTEGADPPDPVRFARELIDALPGGDRPPGVLCVLGPALRRHEALPGPFQRVSLPGYETWLYRLDEHHDRVHVVWIDLPGEALDPVPPAQGNSVRRAEVAAGYARDILASILGNSVPDRPATRESVPMKLLSLDESMSLDLKRANELYQAHINPGLLKAYKVLGTSVMDIESAEGVEIRLRDGRTVLDFSASLGVLALGHNHPRIIAAEQACHRHKMIDAIKVAPQAIQGALAHNLAQMLPDPLAVSFFAVSGAEAVEAAMKICEKAQGPGKTKFITSTDSFHGKTHGALSLTLGGGFQRGFLYGVPAENVISVEYGSIEALEAAIRKEGGSENGIIAFIVEAMQGQGLAQTPDGFLRAASELCKANGVLTIFDEVKMGMGRTGTFCAFQKEAGVVPDVVTLSKALGGGKRAIGAMVCSKDLFDRAYGKREDSTLHTSTFSGLGESCAVAIETLNVYQDENIVEATREKGEYLRAELEKLRQKHPGKITELRGRGLLQGIRFNYNKSFFDRFVDTSSSGLFKTADTVFMVSMIRALYERYGIIVHFNPPHPDVLHIMPPLIVSKEQIDTFVSAIDDMLSRGLTSVVGNFIKGNIKGVLSA